MMRNVTIFRLGGECTGGTEEQLAAHPARPCLGHEAHTAGWVKPFDGADSLIHHVGNEDWGVRCFAHQIEERILPASVVNRTLADKVDEIQTREGRRLRRQERSELKDEVIDALLPQAFTRQRTTLAYVDTLRQWLVIGATGKPAETLVCALRSALGSLPIRPIETVTGPAAVMTGWLFDLSESADIDGRIARGDDISMEGGGDTPKRARLRGLDWDDDAVGRHLADGMQATALAFEWDQQASLTWHHDWTLRGIRVSDVNEDALDNFRGDLVGEFNARAALFVGALRRVMDGLIEASGGPREDQA